MTGVVCRVRWFFYLCLLIGSQNSRVIQAATFDTITLKGVLQSESDQPLQAGKITINGVSPKLNPDGTYSHLAQKAAIYLAKYEAKQHYPIYHTFSHQELKTLKGKLPNVSLVMKRPGRVMLAFGGDAMMGRRFKNPFPGEPRWIRPGNEIQDSKSLLRHIKQYTELADYTSVNLECTLMPADPPQKANKTYVFYSHPATATALKWAGVDYVCLGNNHTYDYLEYGIKSTIDALDESLIAYSGAGTSETEALAAHKQTINGIDLSYLGFVSWKGTGDPHQVAEGLKKGGAAYGTQEKICEAVARESDKDRTVVVQYHGGSEYSYAPSNRTKSRLRAAIENGADLVIGHHPHVLHGFELYQGKLIAYSLGNFIFDQYRYETQRSAIVYVWMDGEQFHRAEIVPIHLQNYHTRPATDDVREYVIRRIFDQSASLGLQLSISGGHATVLKSDPITTRKQMDIRIDHIAAETQPLSIGWFRFVSRNSTEKKARKFQFGKDILLLGDFEQDDILGLSESMWEVTDIESGVMDKLGIDGSHCLAIAGTSNSKASLARQKYFSRFLNDQSNSHMTLTGYVKSSDTSAVSVSLEVWPANWSRSRARDAPQNKELSRFQVLGDKWQRFEIDIEPFKTKPIGYRFCFKNVSQNTDQNLDTRILLDNLCLISWDKTDNRDAISEMNYRANYFRSNSKLDSKDPTVLNLIEFK